MHRGLGLPERYSVDEQGVLKGPATDEVFMRETYKFYKELMQGEPRIAITREVSGG